ncbi:hypothetical protein AB4084_07405, partial [Lysobacter sp. 2RAB21]
NARGVNSNSFALTLHKVLLEPDPLPRLTLATMLWEATVQLECSSNHRGLISETRYQWIAVGIFQYLLGLLPEAWTCRGCD